MRYHGRLPGILLSNIDQGSTNWAKRSTWRIMRRPSNVTNIPDTIYLRWKNERNASWWWWLGWAVLGWVEFPHIHAVCTLWYILRSMGHMLAFFDQWNNVHLAWNIKCWNVQSSHLWDCQNSDSPRIHAYCIIPLSIEDTGGDSLDLHVGRRVALILGSRKHLQSTGFCSWYTHLNILMLVTIICQLQVVLWTCLRGHPVNRSESCRWVDWKNGVPLVGCEHLLHKIWNCRCDRVRSRVETVQSGLWVKNKRWGQLYSQYFSHVFWIDILTDQVTKSKCCIKGA